MTPFGRRVGSRSWMAKAGGRQRAAASFRRRMRACDDSGMTLTEVLIAATLLVVLLTLVAITMGVVTNVSTTVTSQFQEYDQALPALAPLQALLRAQVEPDNASSPKPTPPFAQFGTTSLNFGVQFYSNIGTAYNNLTGVGTTAGPAKIVAVEVDQSGNPVTSTTICTASSPCSFQVRRFLPIVNSGTSTCPVATDGTAGGTCQYPSTYTLITNALHVTNNPSDTVGGVPVHPLFTYSFFDPAWPTGPNSTGTSVLLTAGEILNNLITGLSAAPYNYPTATQGVTTCTATNGSYPTRAIACPLDAIQSVGIDLMVASAGSGPNGTVENQTVVYRYPPTGTSSNLTYPYQFSTAVG